MLSHIPKFFLMVVLNQNYQNIQPLHTIISPFLSTLNLNSMSSYTFNTCHQSLVFLLVWSLFSVGSSINSHQGAWRPIFLHIKSFSLNFFSLRILNHFFSVLWQKVLLKSLMKSNPISYINHVLFIKIIKGFLFFFKFLFLYYNIYFFGFGHCRFIFLGIWCAFSICGFKSLLSNKFFIEIQFLEFV